MQLCSNACRAGNNILRRITRLQQMFGRSFPGQHNKLSRLVCLCGDLRLPCQLRQRGFVADIVDTSSRLIRDCGKRDRMRNVLHISPRPSPSREIIGKQYGRSSITEALEQGEESMKRISRTIHHGQSENRSRDPLFKRRSRSLSHAPSGSATASNIALSTPCRSDRATAEPYADRLPPRDIG